MVPNFKAYGLGLFLYDQIIFDFPIAQTAELARSGTLERDFQGKDPFPLLLIKKKIPSQITSIAYSIKRYLRIRYDIKTGDDICEVVKDLSGTSIANIEPNRDDDIIMEENISENIKSKKSKIKIKTIKGISKLFFWEWPIDGRYSGYIRAHPLPHVGEWNNFSPHT
ncbi:hypothetical protein C2G38_2179780 [Gigaspora rosea]|uniref:Uncharacterized protein n=1 Tax=Gigaspora rosea TaxID=44941 RepID=A0A397VK31_9GLOM|nr:hypothetical protein C2G38_2179780 [Gigaspora rosea]